MTDKRSRRITPETRAKNLEQGRRLEVAMKKAGLLQKQVEAETGIPQSNLSAFINGVLGISHERALKLAKLLKVRSDYFDVASSDIPALVAKLSPENEPPAPDHASPTQPVGTVGILAFLSGNKRNLAPGLAEYLTKHAAKVSLRVAEAMTTHATRAVGDLPYDDGHWAKVQAFYEGLYREEDENPSGGPNGEGGGRK